MSSSRKREGVPSALDRMSGRPVWVNLRALYPPPPAGACIVREGVLVDEIAPGVLKRWMRTAAGDWLGVVNVVMACPNGSTYAAYDQLVPAQALSPR